ncbi:MAG: glycosyltransferase family 4 protein [Terriglobales bacterium]|jgi:glycosyltransferase involved in cell wall biosynthesis|nr:glycosyltransferase family 4 protein [Terriglobales bacterium]
MRILYCNKYNFPFSGTEVYLFEAMELMRASGHEVALFSMTDKRGKPTPYDQYFVNSLDFKSPNASLLGKARQAAHAIYSTEARRKLREMIREFRPDVAHVRNIYHHLSPSILWELKRQGIPVLYHVNDFKLICPSYNMVSHGSPCEKCQGGKFWNVVTERCYQGPIGARWMLAAEAYVHKWLRTYEKCVDRFLAPSRFVKDKLTENGWDEKRIDVLQHFQLIPGIATTNFSGDNTILYFGRLSPEKGVADLLRAMQRLPGIRLIVAGDGPQRQELEALGRELNLKNIEFKGQVDAIALDTLIRGCRFTVFPSRAYETMGKSILESFAGGRAVVASDLGSRRELVHDGETGLLFRPGDVDQLTEVISQLYASPEIAARMGGEGREWVRKKHSQENHYAQLTKIYGELAEKSGRASKKNRPLRVAFIGGRGVVSKYSGIETYYEEAGKRLASMGHEVTVYCRSHFTPPMRTLNQMRLVRLPTIRTKHLETLVHTFLSTVHVMFSDCEIVHYHALGPALFSFLPRWTGKKTIVTVQGLDWQRKKWGWIAARVLRFGEKAATHFPTSTIVVSQTLLKHYQSDNSSPTCYVPNGTLIRPLSENRRLKEWGLQSGGYILFLGRLSPEKNCHLLIEAYENLKPSVKLVLAGGSSHSDAYVRGLRKHQSDQVRIFDWMSGEALDELLTNACLFVLPSDLEGLSLALLDAMGAGVCVLASDIPENLEVVDGAGYTFERGDVIALERMLKLLIENAGLRESAAERARERIQNHYLWPQIASQIEDIYMDVMDRPRDARKPPLAVEEGRGAAGSQVA